MAAAFRISSVIRFAFKSLSRSLNGSIGSNVVYHLAYNRYPIVIMQRVPGSKSQARYLRYAGLLSIFGFYWKKEQPKSIEEQITDIVKMAILEWQKDHHKASEQLLHLALKTAQEHNNSAAIIYIFDLMANYALQRQEFEKAEKLFRRTIQMLLESGTAEDDNAVLEISIKLADIYMALDKENEARTGYLYAHKHLDKKVTSAQTVDEDTILLWGMCADSYGRFLMSLGKYGEACDLFKTAYNSCKEILGESNPQTLILINNIGSASSMCGNYEEGISYLKQAISIARDNNVENLPAFYCNLGMIYLQMGMIMEAETYCKKASVSSKVETTFHNEAIDCLKQVHSLKSS